ncbi:hypothetical protein OKW43_007815 [Paraburkholderia sp. WC7.3g]|uniref:hypothetical protein n=1 Tax=Paraburkholderia sp. WC7.3g TaxID=2991070 RepID=UPI003D1A5D1D
MHLYALVLAVVGFAFGIAAACLWWKASRVSPSPGWEGDLAPVIPELEQLGWNVAFIEAAQKSGALNSTAAILTAIAVVLTTGSTVVGLLPL